MAHQYDTLHSHQVDPDQATPMVRQFIHVKNQYPGVVLFYRMGDFYETFFEDAILTAKALEITLTGRDAGKYGKIPMAGVPVKAVDGYVSRLLAQHIKVAVCEQTEDPAMAKGLVERNVVRVLSSGTVTESAHLNPSQNNYLAAVVFGKKTADPCGFAYCDVTTGEFCVTELTYPQLLSELDRVQPAELLVPGREEKPLPGVSEWVAKVPTELSQTYSCTPLDPRWLSGVETASILQELFQVTSLEGFGLNVSAKASRALDTAGAVGYYLKHSLMDSVPVLDTIQYYHVDETVHLGTATRRHLELTQTVREGRVEGSLLWVLDDTQTSMGTRLLRHWLTQPQKNLPEIQSRQESVAELVQDSPVRESIRGTLPDIYDLERLSSRVANLTAQPRDLVALKQSLHRLPELSQILTEKQSFYLVRLQGFPPALSSLAQLIESALEETPPVQLKEGGIIKVGYSQELDDLREILADQQQWIRRYEETERESTGIKNLKVSFNHAFGYFIEISKANTRLAPDHYVRRQTLTNAERYTTEVLKAQEEKVLDAQSRLSELEYQLFVGLRQELLPHASLLKDVAHRVAALDVLQSLATVAVTQRYTQPVVEDSLVLHLEGSRHPVVEKILPMGAFVPNPCHLQGNVGRGLSAGDLPQQLIITGPNMAGKSTYMRQVALIVLMAQMGSFVPAESARIGVVDSIFTRIGAVDDLSAGQSTFMVEMSETAQILNNATERSLVLLDEVGRGTSTYDGVAIAWSVAEYLTTHLGCRTLFATHYHELNALEALYPHQVKNVRVCITETEGHIEFLHTVEPGAAQKSYGIQVAKMAGVPSEVIAKAAGRLSALQKKAATMTQSRRQLLVGEDHPLPQLSLFEH